MISAYPTHRHGFFAVPTLRVWSEHLLTMNVLWPYYDERRHSLLWNEVMVRKNPLLDGGDLTESW